MRALLPVATVVATLLGAGPSVHAQGAGPVLPPPQTPQSESTGPQDPRSTGSTSPSRETLSERLESNDGVIRPPADIAPDMAIRPRDPGTTRIIPPPGSPGGNPDVQPK
jgi:hypothetical protein